MHGGMEKELSKCGRDGLPFALPMSAAGSAGRQCGRAGTVWERVRVSQTVCWGK